jgi:uncharacterized membrane protein YeaQ/YmgE (transglycosylase-associated protein family)
MLGMSLISFLTLTVIAVVVAAVYHYGIRYRFLEGDDAFFGKLIVGWFGAWLASPVLGHWLWKIENVYLVPAILGAVVTIHMSTLMWKALAKALGTRQFTVEEKKEEFRPARPAAAA